jgi:hypothetical protein
MRFGLTPFAARVVSKMSVVLAWYPAIMKRPALLFILFLLCCSGVLRAQVLPPDMKKTVGFIFGKYHVKDRTGTEHTLDGPLGTGFFILWPDERGGPDWGYFYFITAKHVLKDSDGKFLSTVRVRLNLKSQNSQQNFDYLDLPVTDGNGNLIWFHDLEDPQDEAVAFAIRPDPDRFDYRTIPPKMFVTDKLLKDEEVGEGDSVFFIGLMAQFYGSKQNFPVVRKGSVALMSDEPLPTPNGPEKGYICEVASWPGNSGSPVFLYLGGIRRNTLRTGGYWLLGIIISYYNNSRAAELTDTATISFSDPANIGLAFILPANQITKVLSAPGVQQIRDRYTNEHINQNPQKP